MTTDGFTYQFAIRLPSGDLLAMPAPHNHALDQLRKQAEQLGITHWAGRIEQRICSPFTVTDPAEHFATEVTRWVAENGGVS